MKKLLICLLMVCSTAHAEEWMETPNNAGGKILFLPAKCGGNDDTGRLVIATMSDGGTVHGCWYYFAEMIHVVWQGKGGKTSSFDPKTLTYKKNND